ncbi:patatin-like phospholipase family protein [Gorillibacterium timonense]|uniref:patatin-like phospholipase family protein n=1 Tax=Gorillibacterium timonense TaxID=1689269 RepID=UPI00071D8002|nr:patatin-like phospholipase family protein [Gorillibacterium timonense]
MEVNAVFQGGGVKAIGLAGAVCSAEKHGIAFGRLAGTSSGSIIASLLAAGYTGEELKDIIMKTPFSHFLKHTAFHQIRWLGPAVRLYMKKGLYSGERLEAWAANLLAARGVRRFGDLSNGKLQIIASDISTGRLLVLPDDIVKYGIEPDLFSVSRAIRMSTSIPFFFDPVILRKRYRSGEKHEAFRDQFVYVVDGGLLSNFPLWLFDKDTHNLVDPVPTLGFQLVGRAEQQPNRIVGPLTMFRALFSTMMDAHDERYIDESQGFRTIKIPSANVHTTEFNISSEKSADLFQAGVKAGDKFFRTFTLDRYTKLYAQRVKQG